MPKLIDTTRKLNVGISTAVEFLNKNGVSVEGNNPNVRITDEQHAMLVKEFGQNAPSGNKKGGASSRRPMDKGENGESNVIKTVIPEEYRPKIVTKGRINLDNQNASAKQATVERPTIKDSENNKSVEAKKVVAEKSSEIKTEEEKVKIVEKKPIEKNKFADKAREEKTSSVKTSHDAPKRPEPKKEAETESKESGESGVFRLNPTKFESNIKVTGKIDLSAINQSTRPKKKTKEERKKERDERRPFQGGKPGVNGQQGGKPQFSKPGEQANKAAGAQTSGDDAEGKKKRKRIKKDRVDINSVSGTNQRPNNGGQRSENKHPKNNDDRRRLKKPVKTEVSDEDVQKQIKETLARLTSKGNKNNKGAKYRRDKRDAIQRREHEIMEQEEQESKILKLTEFVTANDLANMMDVPVTKVIGTCMSIGIMVSINQRLDAETINIVADEFGFKTEYVSADVVEAIKAEEEEDSEEDLIARPPIVTVMGHVDHGKTSLLDNIRNANVIAGEAGGITQHIGAYNVKLPSGRRITFLDTPGHEAFTAMRARGAKVTDIAIIIVAADDSVMPQTVEAINHASAAGVPIVFAINKIDKPHANPDKIKEELANMNYLVEDWGGKYQSQEISAKKGIGVEELLEKVLLEADLLDLKANPNRKAVGSIIESSLDKGRGYVSTILVENGTLKVGDVVLAGTHYGRVKAMFNERNQKIDKAAPSEPALILGLNGAPQAGDTFNVLDTDQEAREIATRREQLQRELGLRTQKMLTLDDIGRRIAIGNFQELNVIVKGDVDGSVEALSDSLIRLSTEEIQVNVIHKAVGQISESDVVLAAASNAVIIGFQVRPSLPARRLADKEGVEIRLYSIIYDAIEEVKSAMEGMLSPEIKEEITANVEVQQVFKITKVGTIAGCFVREGKIKRSNKVRVIRDGIVVHTGELGSLKRFKDDVKEVVAGLDCGLNINNYNDIQVGDIIESYEETEIKKTL
jgi:translation initiation factor IF-2